jgi:hypothetical protein
MTKLNAMNLLICEEEGYCDARIIGQQLERALEIECTCQSHRVTLNKCSKTTCSKEEGKSDLVRTARTDRRGRESSASSWKLTRKVLTAMLEAGKQEMK